MFWANENIIMCSFKSSGDIQKKEGGQDSCFGYLQRGWHRKTCYPSHSTRHDNTAFVFDLFGAPAVKT